MKAALAYLVLGLLAGLVGTAAIAGVWRGWIALPMRRSTLGLGPLGVSMMVAGVGVLIDVPFLSDVGVVLILLSAIVTTFFPSHLEPMWYRKLPNELRSPRIARSVGAQEESIPLSYRGQRDELKNPLRHSPGRFIDHLGVPVVVAGISTTAHKGTLRLYDDRLVFEQSELETRIRGWPFSISVPLAEVEKVDIAPRNLHEWRRAVDAGGLYARRNRLRVRARGRDFLFLVRGPRHWVTELQEIVGAARFGGP